MSVDDPFTLQSGDVIGRKGQEADGTRHVQCHGPAIRADDAYHPCTRHLAPSCCFLSGRALYMNRYQKDLMCLM